MFEKCKTCKCDTCGNQCQNCPAFIHAEYSESDCEDLYLEECEGYEE